MYANKTILTVGLCVLLTAGLSYAAGIYPGFREDFESYDVGTDINGQGQWADPGYPGFHDGAPREVGGELVPMPSLIVHEGGVGPFTTKFLTDTGTHWIDDPDPEADPDAVLFFGDHVGYLPLETPATSGFHQFEVDVFLTVDYSDPAIPHRWIVNSLLNGDIDAMVAWDVIGFDTWGWEPPMRMGTSEVDAGTYSGQIIHVTTIIDLDANPRYGIWETTYAWPDGTVIATFGGQTVGRKTLGGVYFHIKNKPRNLTTGDPDADPPIPRLLCENHDPGWMGWDNFWYVPEPATMAVLSLGGLAALIRRR